MGFGRRIGAGKPKKNVFAFLGALLVVAHLIIGLRKLQTPNVGIVLILQFLEALHQILRSLAEHRVHAVTVDQALRILGLEFAELTDINLRFFRRIGFQAKFNQAHQNLVSLCMIVHFDIDALRILVAALFEKCVRQRHQVSDRSNLLGIHLLGDSYRRVVIA